MNDIWVVDDDSSMLWVVERALERAGHRVRTFDSAESATKALGTDVPALVVTDLRMGQMSGFALLDAVHERRADLPVVIMTAFGDLDSAVEAYKHGAYEYLTKPFDIEELLEVVSRGLSEAAPPVDDAGAGPPRSGSMVGDSPAMQTVFRFIGRIADSGMSVLVRGESGTGKELVARAIHDNSSRSRQPFVAINTPAIQSELLESELFGHEKGAFTGAHSQHVGRFEQAHRGTLFLDEIGDMPTILQTRLLRVLSEGSFYRVGGSREISVDVRIIAATNQDLDRMIGEGTFRNDLYHRLNVLALTIPPLRERPEDIDGLVRYFLDRMDAGHHTARKRFENEVIAVLRSHAWPGNVRELENLVYQLCLLSVGDTVRVSDLPGYMTGSSDPSGRAEWKQALRRELSRRLRSGAGNVAPDLSREIDQLLAEEAMRIAGGHKQQAAKLLGWGRNTLARKLR